MAGKKEETKLEAVCLEEGKNPQASGRRIGAMLSRVGKELGKAVSLEGDQGLDRPIGRPRRSPQSRAAYIARLEMENALKYHTELRKILLARRDIGPLSNAGKAIL